MKINLAGIVEHYVVDIPENDPDSGVYFVEKIVSQPGKESLNIYYDFRHQRKLDSSKFVHVIISRTLKNLMNTDPGETMKPQINIDQIQSVLYIKIEGSVDFGDLREIFGSIQENKQFQPNFGLLIDLQNVSYDAKPDDSEKLIRLIKSLRNAFKGKIALIHSSRSGILPFKLIVYIASIERLRIEAFATRDDACNWLGVTDWRPPEKPAPLN